MRLSEHLEGEIHKSDGNSIFGSEEVKRNRYFLAERPLIGEYYRHRKGYLMARCSTTPFKGAKLPKALWIFWIALSAVSAGCTSPTSPNSFTDQDAVPKLVIPATICPQMPRDDYVKGVQNFGFISADVWRGALPTAMGLKSLADLGVKTVIDLREDDESADIPPGVRYVRLPVSMWHADLVDAQAVLRTIQASPKPVFIHCLEGRDRTGLAIAVYRLTQGMGVDDVITEMQNFRVNYWWRETMRRRIRELANAMAKPSTISRVAAKQGGSVAKEDVTSVR